MSNLSTAIEHLEDARELVETESEIDEDKADALLTVADSIQLCEHDLRELAGEED